MTDQGYVQTDSPGPMNAMQYKALASKIAGREKTLDELSDRADFEPTVTQLQLAIAFDDKLKEMASIRGEIDEDDRLTKKQRNAFYTLRSVLVFFYFIVVPYC